MKQIGEYLRRIYLTLTHRAQSMGRANAVRRVRVQGVEMWLPRSHTLPLFARIFPRYGQNLVLIASILAQDGPDDVLLVIDIGANVGDSAIQMSRAASCRILCVEGDPKWLPSLRLNSSGADWCVEPSFVEVAGSSASEIVHTGGTSQLRPTASPELDASFKKLAEVMDAHPQFAKARLIKSDTDGYDCAIVAELLHLGLHDDAVLFFEYDPRLTRQCGGEPAASVWPRLERAGYQHVLVWDNYGNYLGAFSSREAAFEAKVLEGPRSGRPYDYWDVAVMKPHHAALARTVDEASKMESPL